MKRLVIAACGTLLLSGCAAPLMLSAGTMAGVMGGAAVGGSMGKHTADKQQRQRATAASIGPQVDWYSVKVSGVSKRGNMVLWRAKTPVGRYDCSEEDGETLAACTKLE